jgi:hypothetical protein
VAVEKLSPTKFAKIKLRQDDLVDSERLTTSP